MKNKNYIATGDLPIVPRLCIAVLGEHKGDAKAAAVVLGIPASSVLKYASQMIAQQSHDHSTKEC